MDEYKFSDLDNEILGLNQETINNLQENTLTEKINVFSRDWTVQTIYDQIIQGNIELNPKFQRRNAWNDNKRSLLIESLILRLPVPELVLAENHEEDNKFIVIDGKQRLMTILGFIDPKQGYWDKNKLSGLEIKKHLNGKSYNDFLSDETLKDDRRAFENASIRCTVIFGQKTDDLLYQIFYRINSGAVPLSMQELRQALRKGYFSDFLLDITNEIQPIHKVMGLDKPDDRLVDAEIILKYIAFSLFGEEYKGDLKKFLDNAMKVINANEGEYKAKIKECYQKLNQSIEKLKLVFGSYDNIGRLDGDKKFKVNLFEVQALYFADIDEKIITERKALFKKGYEEICKTDSEFVDSFHSSTTTRKNYAKRFKAFENLINSVFDTNFNNKFISYE
jgi:hypothetical protein